jgi:hypothetical protein
MARRLKMVLVESISAAPDWAEHGENTLTGWRIELADHPPRLHSPPRSRASCITYAGVERSVDPGKIRKKTRLHTRN